jgi:hypothetical protein
MATQYNRGLWPHPSISPFIPLHKPSHPPNPLQRNCPIVWNFIGQNIAVNRLRLERHLQKLLSFDNNCVARSKLVLMRYLFTHGPNIGSILIH